MQSPIPLQLIVAGELCETLLRQKLSRRAVSVLEARILFTLLEHSSIEPDQSLGRGMLVTELAAVLRMERTKISRELSTLKISGYVKLGGVGGRSDGYILDRRAFKLLDGLRTDLNFVDKAIRHALLQRDGDFLGSRLPKIVAHLPDTIPEAPEAWHRLTERKKSRSKLNRSA